MPYTITQESAWLRVVLHGALTHQELQALAHDLAAIEAASASVPHRPQWRDCTASDVP